MVQGGAAPETRPVVFALLDRFTFLSFAAAIEPLRLANRMAERPLYACSLVSETGASAEASNGARVEVDGALPECPPGALIVVCGGTDAARAATRPLINWLRREARRGATLAAVCTGAYALARAGRGRRAVARAGPPRRSPGAAGGPPARIRPIALQIRGHSLR